MPRRITATITTVNGGLDYIILCEKSNLYQYEDGKRTSDTPIGTRLTVALPGARLAPLSVRFETDPIPKITDEQIRESIEDCHFLYAALPDCEASIYPSTNGGIGMSATGKTVQLVELEK